MSRRRPVNPMTPSLAGASSPIGPNPPTAQAAGGGVASTQDAGNAYRDADNVRLSQDT